MIVEGYHVYATRADLVIASVLYIVLLAFFSLGIFLLYSKLIRNKKSHIILRILGVLVSIFLGFLSIGSLMQIIWFLYNLVISITQNIEPIMID